MAITKQGKLFIKKAVLNKKSSFLVALPLALAETGAVHVGQNYAMKKLMENSKKLNNAFPKQFLRRLFKPDEALPGTLENVKTGFGQGLIPEIAILHKHVGHLGKRLNSALLEKGIDPEKLTTEQKLMLYKMLRGKFLNAYKKSNPETRKIMASYFNALKEGSGDIILNSDTVRNTIKEVNKNLRDKRLADLNYKFNTKARYLPEGVMKASVKRGLKFSDDELELLGELSEKTLNEASANSIEKYLQNGVANLKDSRRSEHWRKVYNLEKDEDVLTKDQIVKFINTLEKGYKENGFFGPISKALKDRSSRRDILNYVNYGNNNSKSLLSNDEYNTYKNTINNISNAVKTTYDGMGLGLMYSLDPLGFGMNVLKRVMANNELGEKSEKLKKIQNTFGNIFVTKPIKKSFEEGLRGERISSNRNLYNTYGVNATTAPFIDMSNYIGLAYNKAGIKPEVARALYDKFKSGEIKNNIKSKVNDIKGNVKNVYNDAVVEVNNSKENIINSAKDNIVNAKNNIVVGNKENLSTLKNDVISTITDKDNIKNNIIKAVNNIEADVRHNPNVNTLKKSVKENATKLVNKGVDRGINIIDNTSDRYINLLDKNLTNASVNTYNTVRNEVYNGVDNAIKVTPKPVLRALNGIANMSSSDALAFHNRFLNN